MFINYTNVLSKKYKVICIVPYDFKYFDQLASNGVIVRTIKIRNYYDLIASYKFIKLYKEYKPVSILSHNGRFNSVLEICNAIYSFNETVAICHGDTKRLKSFSKIFTVNRSLQKYILERRNQNVKFLPNFIDTTKETKTTSRKINSFTFGILSRLTPEKSVIDAIRGIKNISHQDNIEYKLFIGGTGKDINSLTDYVNKNNLEKYVKFFGWVSNKDDFYSKIDCLLVTSLSETFGLTVLEAFNYSLPVISTKTDGPSEFIEDGINGFLFDHGDIQNLIKIMEKLSKNPVLAKKIGNSGFDTLQQNFTEKSFESRLFYLLSSDNK